MVEAGTSKFFLDPQNIGTDNDFGLLRNIFEPLIAYDQEMRLQPCLATEWWRIDDTTTRFRLRRGVKFHDGEDFNADAVWFTFYRLLHPATAAPMASAYNLIKHVTRIEPDVVDITTNWPDATLLSRLACTFACIVPSRSFTIASQKSQPPTPLGTGPYRFAGQVGEGIIGLEANPYYWGIPPKIKQAIVSSVPQSSTAVALRVIQGGDDDNIGIETETQNQTLVKSSVVTTPGNRIVFFSLDLRRPPFDNQGIRQALNAGVNFERVVTEASGEGVARVATLVGPGVGGSEDTVKPIQYNPGKAKALMARAGYSEKDTDFYLYMTPGVIPNQESVIPCLVSEIRRFGLSPIVKSVKAGDIEAMGDAGNLDGMALRTWDNWLPDADNALYTNYHSSSLYARMWQGYKNERLDRILEQARGMFDVKKRARLYTDAQLLLQDDCPSLFGWVPLEGYRVQNEIDWTPRPDHMILLNEMSIRR